MLQENFAQEIANLCKALQNIHYYCHHHIAVIESLNSTGLPFAMFPGSVAGLPKEMPTMPQLLRKAGYSAHMVTFTITITIIFAIIKVLITIQILIIA